MGIAGRFQATMAAVKRNSHDPYIKGRAMEVGGPILDELKGAWTGTPVAPSGQDHHVVAVDDFVGQSLR